MRFVGAAIVALAALATLGGYFPGVDTFLGLQIAAQEICDDLAKLGFCKKFGVAASTRQWWRWARHQKI